MQKKLLISIIFLFITISQVYPYFQGYDLNGNYAGNILEYKKFITEIKVNGLFYETSINFMVIPGKDYYCRNWQQRSGRSGPYELVWTFNLPEESFITDCMIMGDNGYISAQVIDLSTAEENYNPKSSNTPQVLLREYRNRKYDSSWDHFYQLRVAPVGLDEEKDIIIKYITPCDMYWAVRRIGVHSRQFYQPGYLECNNHAPAEFNIIDYNNPDKAPRNIYNFNFTWEKQGEFWHTQTGPQHIQFDQNSILRVEKENTTGTYLQTYSDGANQFYQTATLPHISHSEKPARHIVIAFDLIQDYYSQRESNIAILKYPLFYGTSSKDSLAFVTSSFNVEWLDKEFKQCSQELILSRLDDVKQIIPKLSSLPFILREAVDFLNKHNTSGEIWLISNDSQYGYPEGTVMDIVRQTHFAAKNNIKFRIIDMSRNGSNRNLYENLSRLSKGTLTNLREFVSYNWADAMHDGLAPMVAAVEIDPMPSDGLAYSRVPLNRGRTNFNITSRYFEIGMFDGNVPFQMNYFGNFRDKLYQKLFEMKENSDTIPVEMKEIIKKYWYANYIINELLLQPQNYETIKYIEQLSTENRVLTPYSGFVIPGPDGYIGFKKLTAADSIQASETLPNDEEVQTPENFSLSAYPNPFNPTTTIQIEMPDLISADNATLHILNILGQTVKSYDLKLNNNSNTVQVTWDGHDLNDQPVVSGIYFVLFRTNNFTKNLKITLLR